MVRRSPPSLTGATGWVNSDPLDLDDLRGHAVLVDFWTLTCINWLRTVPHTRAWSEAYRHDGLVVIGVHTPEFSFEHRLDGVERAVRERGIDYPVAADNDYAIWKSFDNHYWPALYFIDVDGAVRDHHVGEGSYAQSERMLQRLLGIQRDLVSVTGTGVEAEADWHSLRTPETYLGFARRENFTPGPTGVSGHRQRGDPIPGLRSNHWTLDGSWAIEGEKIVLTEPGGRISFRFHARDAHLVLNTEAGAPVPFHVLLDGEAPGPAHGADVGTEGDGLLRDGRLYQLVRQPHPVRERILDVVFQAPGVEAYAFTFG